MERDQCLVFMGGRILLLPWTKHGSMLPICVCKSEGMDRESCVCCDSVAMLALSTKLQKGLLGLDWRCSKAPLNDQRISHIAHCLS